MTLPDRSRIGVPSGSVPAIWTPRSSAYVRAASTVSPTKSGTSTKSSAACTGRSSRGRRVSAPIDCVLRAIDGAALKNGTYTTLCRAPWRTVSAQSRHSVPPAAARWQFADPPQLNGLRLADTPDVAPSVRGRSREVRHLCRDADKWLLTDRVRRRVNDHQSAWPCPQPGRATGRGQ
jgi:hypothetical protein